jgi:hypothetical protein
MWADTLMSAERAHLLRLLWWGAASVVLGVTALVAVQRRRPRPMLIWHFAVQTAAWGAVDVALVAAGWHTVRPRDVNGYQALREFLWLNVGLDVGYAGVGLALGACGWLMGRRLGLVGAGTGIVVQGLALLALDAWLIVVLNRMAVA